MEKTYDAPSLLRIVDSLLVDPSTLHSFYGADIRKDDFKRDVVKFVPMVQFFVEKYPARIDRISACAYCPHQVECTIIMSKYLFITR